MKNFVPVLALAAGVTATFDRAPPFTCPSNTDNKCTEKQLPGFSWLDLNFGDFSQYGDFNFRGWKCEEDAQAKKSRFAPRTFGKKVIGGTCHSEKHKSPSFGCGANIDKFSLGSIHVKPEFDCDLEFHYDMPDGSTCKHRSRCSKSGTTVRNSQCGGAKNVTIVFPPQPNKPKPSCSIQVPTISFDCSTAQTTKTRTSKTKTKTKTTEALTTTAPAVGTTTTSEAEASSTSTSPAETISSVAPGSTSTSEAPQVTSTASVPGAESSTATVPGQESSTKPAEGSSTSEAPATSSPVTKTVTTSYDSTSTIFTTSIQTITSCAPTVTNCPANSVTTTIVTIPVSTTICPVTETQTIIESSPVTVPGSGPSASASVSIPGSGPSGSASVSVPAQESSTKPAQGDSTSEVSPATSSPVTKTITTSYDSTSTIFTTSIQTITSCAPTVTNCPANSVVTTIVTIPVSTTICPVTETQTVVESSPVTVPGSGPSGSPSASTPVAGGSSSSAVSSVAPVETLPCPGVVPSCLNTFLFTTGCSSNTDAECYCPDATFVKNVYDCLYAHGETDEIVAEAIAYFQGICGKFVNDNPAIVTGPSVTSYITVTATPTAAVPVTTVVVDVTTVVPCTNDAGEVIPSSSTTVTVSTSMTVPQIGFTTAPAGGVDVIPITSAPAAPGSGSGAETSALAPVPGAQTSVPAGGAGGAVTTAPAATAPGAGSSVTVPTGTGSLRPSASSPVVIAGSGRVGASFGLAAVVAFVAAVAL
ncbi:uncharacterized protein B0T15DRAFT_507437 [Chaetomium strumarium]|uniref:CFEM domain-containing protein n=1 Tax=Chaetomium strumarium TaxID=1170767 RepID=A0AAJ0M6K6_9PEZI|nr:hypothetical protein B0T15DRAFT_507437 [Chaetomium strumarium]